MLSHHPDYPQWKTGRKCSCGAENARFDFVPDSIYGLSIVLACCIHDHRYELGGTQADKDYADLEFLANMKTIINNYKLADQVGRINKIKCAFYPHYLAGIRANNYYEAVLRAGDSSFNFHNGETYGIG